MKPNASLSVLALLLVGAMLSIVQAQQPAAEKSAAKAESGAAAGSPVYTPPLRGAPARRVGGSSRGAEQALPGIAALAPDHVGLTVSEQPDLYWYLSKPTPIRIEITLIDSDGVKPVMEYAVGNAAGPAIHRISLADLAIRLKPDVEYQWSVALVPNAAERSNDILAGGALKRIAVRAALAARIAGAPMEELPGVYASEGIWYDALATLSDMIRSRPQDRALRDQRAALLQQVGLSEVAEFDRGQAR